jgi:cell division protein FtsW
MARRVIHDPWLLITTAFLVGSGLFMVGSASNHVAIEFGRDPSSFGWRHAVHLLMGAVAMFAALSFPYQRLVDRPWKIKAILAVTFSLLLIVLAMPEISNARRWIPLVFFNLQPSELAKLSAVVYMADLLARKQERINELWSVPFPCLMTVGAMALLVIVEPDLGSAVIPMTVAGVLLFVAGLKWRYIGAFSAVGAVGFVLAVFAEPYRIARMMTFMDPWADPLGKGYQLCQSLIAFGNGGMTGMGMGGGLQRALFLPAPHTDFIYSIVGEDYGLVGCLMLLGLFVLLFWRGTRVAMRAPDRFGFYLAMGLTCTLVLQALINMAVCLGMLPTKGLPLPFISYGGTSLVASMAMMGLLLNVSLHSGR